MDKSTLSARSGKDASQKPAKRYPDFPHATMRWAKKVCGKLHYFGN